MIIKKQIFIWFGENDFEIHEKLAKWRDIFEKKYSGLNIIHLDLIDSKSREFNGEIKNALQVDSLFGSNKLIVLKNFLIPAAKLDKEIEQMIINTLQKLSASFFVVFIQEEKLDVKNNIYTAVKKIADSGIAEIKEFRLPKEKDLVKWILERAGKYQVALSPEAVNLLAASVGNDLWQLDTEISKLANYKKNGEKVMTEDVSLLVKGKYNDDIFQLMDAISDKDKKKALQLFNDQLNSGANEMYLLTMLVRQFRIFWQVKELVAEAPLAGDQVARDLGIHPYVAKKTLYYLRNFSLPELRAIYKKLLSAEIQIKTKNVDFELLFDLMVAGLK